jgi:hypothetical protein
MAEGKSNKTLLYAGIGGGVFLLLTCCCLGGVGGWFFFLRGGPEKKIVGKWGLDMDAMKKNEPMLAKLTDEQFKKFAEEAGKFTVEFKSDGTFVANEPGKTTATTGKWKKIDSKGDVLTIETKDEGKDWERVEITIVDSTHIKVVQSKGESKTIYLKKV